MPDDTELVALIRHGREERNLEYKGPVSWQTPAVKARITKCSMALANIQDGGAIVIGVQEVSRDFVPVGLEPADRDSFAHLLELLQQEGRDPRSRNGKFVS